MPNHTVIPSKAVTPFDRSDSIVVSFGAEWYKYLHSEAVSVVIRKRVPKDNSFKWIYFHINSPVSAICGRAEIQKIDSISAVEAVVHAKHIGLTPSEIMSYIGMATSIGRYKLGAFEFGANPIPIARLVTRLAYYPPQSFFILSKEAKRIVDELAGLTSSNIAQPRSAGSS